MNLLTVILLISGHKLDTIAVMGSYFEFLKAAASNPMKLSTVFQTSPWLARDVIAPVTFETAKHIMELGSGAGAITSEVAPRLSKECQFTGFELVPSLAEYLRKNYPAKMEFVTGSAELAKDYANKKGPADFVVSSLPWTVFSEELQESILTSVHAALKPGGKFMTYMCINANLYPTANSFKSKIKSKFAVVEKRAIEWRNIPPAAVYVCTKQ